MPGVDGSADRGGFRWPHRTVEKLRERFVTDGFDQTLQDKQLVDGGRLGNSIVT